MTESTGGHPGAHGSLTEEAAKLAEAIAGWASGAFSGSVAEPLLDGAGQSPECRLCPVCQLLRLVQGSRPEVYQHLADASVSLLAAVRAAVESSQATWASGQRPVSERIDIR